MSSKRRAKLHSVESEEPFQPSECKYGDLVLCGESLGQILVVSHNSFFFPSTHISTSDLSVSIILPLDLLSHLKDPDIYYQEAIQTLTHLRLIVYFCQIRPELAEEHLDLSGSEEAFQEEDIMMMVYREGKLVDILPCE